MKQYSIFHVPFMSFYSKALYRDVCLNWKGVAFGYLFLLVMVCLIPQLMKIHSGWTGFVENDLPSIVYQVPRITIEDGQASIEEPQPYTIVEPESGEVIVVIDTTGAVTSLKDAGAPVLLTRTKLITKKNEFQTQVIELSEIGDMVIDQDWINRWVGIIKPWVVPVICVFAIPFAYVRRMIQVLIYGAIGLLFARWRHSKRSYASLIRMSVLAMTPVLIVRTLLSLASIRVPFDGLIGFGVVMGYLYFGVSACANHDEPGTGTDYQNGALGGAPIMTPGPLVTEESEPVDVDQSTGIARDTDEPDQRGN
ncbi:MAG: DUF1189 domain-containing protein [Planctomycetota bacterium]|jgi:hypothetical protein